MEDPGTVSSIDRALVQWHSRLLLEGLLRFLAVFWDLSWEFC